MRTYKCLNQQVFESGEYRLVPIRYEDRYAIMKWRNEQIDILRQSNLLTEKQQDDYFNNVITKLFNQDEPNQLLFSFLKQEELIAYGGLVHIDWQSLNAEVSFLISSDEMSEKNYQIYSSQFFPLISEVASCCGLKKVYTYGYDISDYRFIPLYKNGFSLEAYLHEHVKIGDKAIGVRIYGKHLR